MTTRTPETSLEDALDRYGQRWPDEADRVAQFRELGEDVGSPFDRARLAGHFTGSAWRFDRAGARVLLTHHR